MTQEDMIHILNQHGLDVLHNVICNEVNRAYDDGYEKGLHDGNYIGRCECYDMMSDDD